jgi:hypothetical protein
VAGTTAAGVRDKLQPTNIQDCMTSKLVFLFLPLFVKQKVFAFLFFFSKNGEK